MSGRLQGSIALVTGASRGIGAAVAKKYAYEGSHVIIAARTASGLEETDDAIKSVGGSSTIVPIDLTEHAKIDQLGGLIYERFGRLDILVGNAAMLGHLSPMHHIEPKTWEKTIALNLTANFRLLRSMDPLLRMSKAGRAIFVTSSLANENLPYWGAYAVSKSGLQTMVKTYALEVQNTNIKANLVDPSSVGTRMFAEAMPGADLSKMKQPEEVTEIFVKLAESSFDENGGVYRG